MTKVSVSFDLSLDGDKAQFAEVSALLTGDTAAKEAKTSTSSRTTKAADKDPEPEEKETKAPTSKARTRPSRAKAKTEEVEESPLEKLMSEGAKLLTKVQKEFKEDIADEMDFFKVKKIADFKKLDDLQEFVDFLKELEQELED